MNLMRLMFALVIGIALLGTAYTVKLLRTARTQPGANGSLIILKSDGTRLDRDHSSSILVAEQQNAAAALGHPSLTQRVLNDKSSPIRQTRWYMELAQPKDVHVQLISDTAPTTEKADNDGFVSLFDGKDLDGWKVGANAESWKVEDGQIVVHGPGPSHLFYVGPVHNHDWKNFHLRAEVMTYPHANSGIYFHTSYQESDWPADGFEAQVNCTHGDWKKTGSLYAIQDIKDPHQVDNKWFVYDVIVKGDTVTLKIDGQTVNEWTEPKDFKPPADHAKRYLHHGTVALQGHDPGSEVHYKSILIKPLDD